MPKETDRLKLPLPLGNENVTRESINGIFEKIDAGVPTQGDLDALRTELAQIKLTLRNNFGSPDEGITIYPEGYSVFYVGNGTEGKGAAWRIATGSTEAFGYVETVRIGTGGYQMYTEMYSGTDITNRSNNKQYKRNKRDNNSYWQPFERVLDAEDYITMAQDYIRQPGFAITSGTSTDYAVTLSPSPKSVEDGFGITIIPHINNATNPKLNINGFGPLPLKDQRGYAYEAGKIQAGKPYTFRRVGTDFLADSSGGYGNAVAKDIRATKTASTDLGEVSGALVTRNTSQTNITPTVSVQTLQSGIYDYPIVIESLNSAIKLFSSTYSVAARSSFQVTKSLHGISQIFSLYHIASDGSQSAFIDVGGGGRRTVYSGVTSLSVSISGDTIMIYNSWDEVMSVSISIRGL